MRSLAAFFVTWAWLTPASVEAQYAGRQPEECTAMSTPTVEVIAYRIRPNDRGCARIARHHFGDRNAYELIHQYNPDLGPTPHRFQPGTYLCLPAARGNRATPPARITALRHRVRHRQDPAEDWEPASMGQDIERGSRVSTLDDAFAELTFRDDTVVTLRSDTLVVVYGPTSGAVRRTGSEAVLERGALRTRLARLRRRSGFEVRTPSSTVSLGEGASVTSVDPAQTTRVSNQAGAPAAVRAGGTSVRVPAGMGSKVRRGERPSRPRPLPAAPQWVSEQPARFLGLPGLTSAHGAWQSVDDTRTYRVEIRRAGATPAIVAQAEVPSTVTRFELYHLPPGAYEARVSTIDGDYFESRESEPWSFEILLAEMRLPDASESVAAPDRFVTESARALTIRQGTLVRFPEGLRCGLGGHENEAREIQLAEQGTHEIACRDEAGGAVSGVSVEVVGVDLYPQGTEEAIEIERGQEVAVDLMIEGNARVDDWVLEPSPGLELRHAERLEDRYQIQLFAASSAPATGYLRFGPPEGEAWAVVSVQVVDPPPLPPPEAAEAEPPPRWLPWPQTFGTVLFPGVVGLRDTSRPGVGGWFSMGFFDIVLRGDTRLRASGGVHAALLESQLHIELAAAGDFFGDHRTPSQRGSGDLYAAAGYSPVIDGVDLLLELTAFFPTQPDSSGLGAVRLGPQAHLGIPLFRNVLLLRTRQGAYVDLDASENVSWVSAYGIDVRPVEPLTIGAELDLSIGQEDRDLVIHPLLGATVALTLDVFVLSAGARFALSSDVADVFGTYSIFATVEGGWWFPLDG